MLASGHIFDVTTTFSHIDASKTQCGKLHKFTYIIFCKKFREINFSPDKSACDLTQQNVPTMREIFCFFNNVQKSVFQDFDDVASMNSLSYFFANKS